MLAGKFTINGSSTAGIATSLHVPQLKAVLDVGTYHTSCVRENHLFLSHCHMDHIGSLLSFIGHKDLNVHKHLSILVPEGTADGVSELARMAEVLGTSKLDWIVQPLCHGDTYEYSGIKVTSIKTHHVVPSNGYLFSSEKSKLKSEFIGTPGADIARLRKNGVEVLNKVQHLDLAYCTDTTIDFIDSTPEVLQTDVLIMECTFLDDTVSVESARGHGHIHIDEIAANAERFENKHLVLMHFSTRYSLDDIKRIVDEKLGSIRDKITLILP